MKKLLLGALLFCSTGFASIIQVTEDSFDRTVLKSKSPVILDVKASWCGPCAKMEPIFEELSNEYPEIQFVQMDYDSQARFAQKLGVKSLPTIFFFKPGKNSPVMKHEGLMSKSEFQSKIDKVFKN